jgi:hypothetical protein
MNATLTFLPIVQRELRVAARRTSTFRIRTLVAILTSLIGTVFLLFGGAWSAGRSGNMLFTALSALAFFFCLFEGARSAADCLSEEKREGTLGFLFLTDLRGYDVVLGKFAAIAVKAFQGLLAFFPILAIALILGGVTMAEFWRTAIVLITALFFSLALGLLVSSLSRESHRALGTTLFLIALTMAVPPIVQRLLGLIPMRTPAFLYYVSPGYAQSLASDFNYPGNAGRFWLALLLMHLGGWLFLVLAGLIIPKAWQDKPASDSRWGGGERALRRRFGKPIQRARLRNLLLEVNPVLWLAARNDGERVQVWRLLGLVGGGALLVWILSGLGGGFANELSAGFISILTLALKVWVASHASATFAEAGRNGSIELFLVTPMTVEEIIRGQWLALKRFFLYPVLMVLAIQILIVGIAIWQQSSLGGAAAGPLALRSGTIIYQMIRFVVDLVAISWVGMWMGLTRKKPAQAFANTLLVGWLIPTLIFCIPNVLIDLVLINWAKPKLYRDFRKMATERFGQASEKPSRRSRALKKQPPSIPPAIPSV